MILVLPSAPTKPLMDGLPRADEATVTEVTADDIDVVDEGRLSTLE